MKKNFTLRIAALFLGALAFGQVMAQDVTETISVKNDVSLRSDNPTKKNATDKALELKVNKTDGEVTARFVGLMSFDIPAKAGYAIKSASLRLVTERAKGTMDVYAFNAAVSDDDTYGSQSDNITAALSEEALLSVKLAGTNGKAVSDAGASSNIDDWVNTLDLTSTVKKANGTLALLLACEGTTSIKVYSSDAEDVTNTKVDPNFTFAAADLKPVLTIVYEKDTDSKVNTSSPLADTWVRLGNTKVHGSDATMEICSYINEDDATKNKTFLGLMSFQLPDEVLSDDYELKSATLRLVSERVKGTRTINIYAYPATFDESTIYADEEGNITNALTEDNKILTFEAKGSNKAMGIDQLPDNYKTVDAWTNVIDLTEYIKTLTDSKFGILLEKGNSNESTCFYTKEAADVVNAKDETVTFAADDLVPQLTVSYSKKTSDGIEEVVTRIVTDGQRYNLAGQRISQPQRGQVYIMNGKKYIAK